MKRITITIPGDLLALADAEATRQRRSRSGVIVEALRRFLSSGVRERGMVAEPVGTPYAVTPGLGELRLAQLQADMALTPEHRVREAETSTEDAFRIHRIARAPSVMAFERYEDYLEWKRRDRLW